MPLLLEHFRTVCGADTAQLKAALAGLGRYQAAERESVAALDLPVTAQVGAARLLRVGSGNGAPVVLIPSIINGPQILHLAPDYSFAEYLAGAGYVVHLLDWGAVDATRADEGLEAQVTDVLIPLLAQMGRPSHLVGYCLGGLHAMAAAQLGGATSLTMIASPWDFAAYPDDRRTALSHLWAGQRAQCEGLQCAPVEVLQSAFWQLDPAQLVQKYAKAATMESAKFAHFVRVEDWANSGEALPLRAATDIVERHFAGNLTGTHNWRVAGQIIAPDQLKCPALSVRSNTDRIVPFASSPVLTETLDLADGHVGMMIGSRRKSGLWAGVRDFIRRA